MDNVVVVVFDTARFDVFSKLLSNGHLPTLKRVAKAGGFIENAVSNAPWTVPSHGSMFTGEYPAEHGITGKDPTYVNGPPLVYELSSAGYHTLGFSANPWLSSEFGFDQGFDTFLYKLDYLANGPGMIDIARLPTVQQQLSGLAQSLRESLLPTAVNFFHSMYWTRQSKDTGAKTLCSRAKEYIQKAPGPYFAFFNFTEPHLAYSLPSQYLPNRVSKQDLETTNQDATALNIGEVSMSSDEIATLRSVYESTFKYLDDQLATLFESIDLDRTTVVILGDHGELFGENGKLGHQYSLNHNLLRVPLIVSDGKDRFSCNDTLVETRQVYDFIRQVAGLSDHEKLGSPHAIAEYVSPHPSLEEMQQRRPDRLPERITWYADGARSILSANGRQLIENADGQVVTDGVSKAGDADVLNDYDSLQRTLLDERGEFEPPSGEYEVSRSVESQLEELGYK